MSHHVLAALLQYQSLNATCFMSLLYGLSLLKEVVLPPDPSKIRSLRPHGPACRSGLDRLGGEKNDSISGLGLNENSLMPLIVGCRWLGVRSAFNGLALAAETLKGSTLD